DVILIVSALRLEANFVITSSTAADGASELAVDVTDLSFGIGGTAAAPLLGISVASAQFSFRSTGIVASVQGIVPQLNVPGITLAGTLGLQINTPTVEDLGVLPNTIRVSGVGLEIGLLGQSISGDFSFEQVTTTTGQSIIKVAVANLEAQFGGENAGLRLSEGNGLILMTSNGMAASIGARVEVLPAGQFRIEGALELQINSTGSSVNQTFRIGAAEQTLVLP